jgi:hypothetical protein
MIERLNQSVKQRTKVAKIFAISSYQLAKELGITQKSSWFMGHRIRKACKNNDAILSGILLYAA